MSTPVDTVAAPSLTVSVCRSHWESPSANLSGKPPPSPAPASSSATVVLGLPIYHRTGPRRSKAHRRQGSEASSTTTSSARRLPLPLERTGSAATTAQSTLVEERVRRRRRTRATLPSRALVTILDRIRLAEEPTQPTPATPATLLEQRTMLQDTRRHRRPTTRPTLHPPTVPTPHRLDNRPRATVTGKRPPHRPTPPTDQLPSPRPNSIVARTSRSLDSTLEDKSLVKITTSRPRSRRLRPSTDHLPRWPSHTTLIEPHLPLRRLHLLVLPGLQPDNPPFFSVSPSV